MDKRNASSARSNYNPRPPENSSPNHGRARGKGNDSQPNDIINYSTPKTARVRPPSTKNSNASRRYPNSPRYRYKFRTPDENPLQIPTTPKVINGPITPKEAIKYYSDFLTDYEKEEISIFPDIYYVGKKESKINPTDSEDHNQGFDDDSNNLELRVGDHLAYRFEIVSLFGSGAFGRVIKCIDHKTNSHVAVKVIVNTDQMHEQGQVEAQILTKLNSYNQHHIVRAYDFFVFRSHICITFEILGMSLYDFSENNNFTPLPPRLVRLYALQILSALEQVHRAGAIHCDIKPENILLLPGSKTLVKLVDFGSGCFDGHQKYFYIQSRFYRAPEVILGIPYGPSIDIWSTMLVLVEMMTGSPLFPGDDELEQLWMISELLGEPPRELVAKGNRREEFFDEDCNLLNVDKKRKPRSMNLQKLLKTNDPMLVDFLMKCLTWDPNERLTIRQALQHPWIRNKEVKVAPKPSALPSLEIASKRSMCM
ncbi:hypothetical protein M9Y10_004998 [Tritrichomonas musculus]|uniref:dual-specificity kinase n=1 Tax=Tritrichomonas musculus TaxID=1915356 RepID=A0ABR2JK21_9EUKA